MPIFSRTEVERRWAALWQTDIAADCIVTSSFHNSYSLSGFPMHPWGRIAITILFRTAELVLIVPELEATAASQESPIADIRSYNDDDGPSLSAAAQLLIDILTARGPQVIGIDADAFPVALHDRRRGALRAPVIDVGEQIDQVRLISSSEELVYIREAVAVADLGMETVVASVRPGADEAALAEAANATMMHAVPSDTDATTLCVVQQGERQSTRCHRRSASIPIADRQTLQVWSEAYVAHYCGNVERCLILGDVPRAVRRACATALEAYAAAAQLVRPGATFAQVHRAARNVLIGAGYTNIPTGSGLVRSILSTWAGRIESGNLRAHNHRELRPGMVISVEPWAVIDGVGAPHLATTLLVTENGHEVLNRYPSVVPTIENA